MQLQLLVLLSAICLNEVGAQDGGFREFFANSRARTIKDGSRNVRRSMTGGRISSMGGGQSSQTMGGHRNMGDQISMGGRSSKRMGRDKEGGGPVPTGSEGPGAPQVAPVPRPTVLPITPSPTNRPSVGPAPEPTPQPNTDPTPEPTPVQTTAVPTSTPAVVPTGTNPPTPFPTHKARVHNVLQWLVDQGIAKQTDFADANTHQFQAARWIADEDAAALAIPATIGEPDAYHFIERYVMALLFFSTKGKAWSYNFRFFSPESVCKWNVDITLPDSRKIQIGVVCDGEDGRIVSLNIPQNNLVGTLMTELGLLSNLDFLALNHNVLGGTIPKELGDLTKLSYMALHYNELKGKLPTWIENFESLRVLGLGDNRLSGSIPTEWSSLAKVRTLGLDNNMLTGNLTPLAGYSALERAYLEENKFTQDLSAIDWSQMQILEELDLSSNQIGGTLPTELLNLPNLRVLDLGSNLIGGVLKDFSFNGPSSLKYFGVHGNLIGGTIPTTIDYLNNLTHLDLSENAFTKFIPEELGRLTNLEYFFIADNDKLTPQIIPPFIGTLTNLRDLSLKGTNRVASIAPDLFSKLNKLILLELDNNELSGSIPSEIGALSTLTYLLLNRNNVVGTVPSEVQLLPNLDIFLVDRTNLVGDLSAMCLERQHKPEIAAANCYGDTPQVVCTCCNICCEDGVNMTDCRDRVYFGQLDPVWENSYQRRYYQFADEDFGDNEDQEFGNANNLGDANDIGTGDQLGTGTSTTLNLPVNIPVNEGD
mmetsp:Transcript_18145/g.30063  ORF Transcript_18145/g.30063 Transcript_18145/m.30063 type:complete len:763 (-) Transcript_18145:75-2363(-)